jgi:hypothetical protein
MPEIIKHYKCTICGTVYDHFDEALSCEALSCEALSCEGKGPKIRIQKLGLPKWEPPAVRTTGPGTGYKLHNRRVTVFPTQGGVLIKCKRLGGAGEPRVVTSKLALSDDAAFVIHSLVEDVLRKKGYGTKKYDEEENSHG